MSAEDDLMIPPPGHDQNFHEASGLLEAVVRTILAWMSPPKLLLTSGEWEPQKKSFILLTFAVFFQI